MFHAVIIDLHVLHGMHVIMLMYMHVSCNMHEFLTFSIHVAHACCHMREALVGAGFGEFAAGARLYVQYFK